MAEAVGGRFVAREGSELRRELLVEPWPELGLVAAGGPADPEPELVVEDGVVTRLDGRAAADFDVIDRFLVAHGLDLEVAAEAMALPDERIARMLVDVDVPREALVRLARGLTPAKLARVVGMLDPVELMMALKKLRARRDPATRRMSRTSRRARPSSPPTPRRPRGAGSTSWRRRSGSRGMRRSTRSRSSSARRRVVPG